MNGCFTEGPVCPVTWVDLLFYEIKPSILHYLTVINCAVILPCHRVTLSDENSLQAALWSVTPSCSVEDVVMLSGKRNTRRHTLQSPRRENTAKHRAALSKPVEIKMGKTPQSFTGQVGQPKWMLGEFQSHRQALPSLASWDSLPTGSGGFLSGREC